MTIIYVISIKNAVLASLLLGSECAKRFFADEISKIIVDHIVIDFSDVKVMNRSLAIQYLFCKQNMKEMKLIREINLSKNICRIIQTAEIEFYKFYQKTNVKRNDPILIPPALVLDNS